MAALQKGAIQGDRQGSGGSDVESDDDNEDGDYTVYECPGLAPVKENDENRITFHCLNSKIISGLTLTQSFLWNRLVKWK